MPESYIINHRKAWCMKNTNPELPLIIISSRGQDLPTSLAEFASRDLDLTDKAITIPATKDNLGLLKQILSGTNPHTFIQGDGAVFIQFSPSENDRKSISCCTIDRINIFPEGDWPGMLNIVSKEAAQMSATCESTNQTITETIATNPFDRVKRVYSKSLKDGTMPPEVSEHIKVVTKETGHKLRHLGGRGKGSNYQVLKAINKMTRDYSKSK